MDGTTITVTGQDGADEIIVASYAVAGIYRIVNVENDDAYIGSSIDIKARWRQHRCRLGKDFYHGSHLQNAWNKYGDDIFRFEIAEIWDVVGLTKRQARQLLRFMEQTAMNEECPAYNKAPAAESNLGFKHSDETKAKLSASQKGKVRWPDGRPPPSPETRARISATLTGFKHSDEARANMSAGQKNKPPESDETRAKKSASMMGNQNGIGHVVSEEARAAIGAKHKGKEIPLEMREQISKKITDLWGTNPEIWANRYHGDHTCKHEDS